jgi:DNA-binding transcriptional LysR family regulator
MKNDETEADKASMRLKDLRLASELLAEAVAQENGARERVAERYGIQKSVITDRVRRIEKFFGVDLFKGTQRKTPTRAGEKMAKYGPMLISEIEDCAVMLRRASERDEVHQPIPGAHEVNPPSGLKM